jgi:hypothetical protein
LVLGQSLFVIFLLLAVEAVVVGATWAGTLVVVALAVTFTLKRHRYHCHLVSIL